jgi:Ca-activated chloride channel homolog
MKRFLIITLFTAAFAGAVLLTLFVKTTTANADITAGNQAYAAQDYDAALQRYMTAQAQAPGQVEPAYNAANTYYRQNVPDKAQQTLEQTLAQPHNAMAEFVHFNLGNIAYNGQQFAVAIAHYEAALRLQPDDRDAKYNLELALQQKQQQDQQNQQNQQQQNQDQQQHDQQDQNQQNQQNQSSDQQNQSGGQQDQQQKQQDRPNGEQGDQQNQQQDQPDQQNSQQGDQQKQQDQPDQQNGQQGDQQNRQQDQQPGQQTGQPNQPQSDQPSGQASGARPQQGLTPEQAKRLLAVVGGNSKTLMEKLQLMYMVSGANPDKDW